MIPKNFRRGESRAKSRQRPRRRAACKNARVISTASFVGRFHFLLLEAALCSDPYLRDQNIRPAGPPWRECALPGAEKTSFSFVPIYGTNSERKKAISKRKATCAGS